MFDICLGLQRALGQAPVPPSAELAVAAPEVPPAVPVPIADRRPTISNVEAPPRAPVPQVVELIELSDEGKRSSSKVDERNLSGSSGCFDREILDVRSI